MVMPFQMQSNFLASETLADLFGGIDVEADQLAVGQAVAHRRERVIKTDNKFAILFDLVPGTVTGKGAGGKQ